MNQKVGVVGLGLMGSALADGMLAHGFDLTVWNRSPDKCSRFAEQGVAVADSMEGLALASDIVVVCLTDHAASMELLNPGSVTERMSAKTLVLLTTMTADESIATAEWAESNGISYLDGAILGYPDDVRDQNCVVAYSGSQAVFDSCHAVLNAMGEKPRLVGEQAGASLCFDKAIYSYYYARTFGLLHGAVMCAAAGVPLDIFIEVTSGNTDQSARHEAKFLTRVKNRDYALSEASMEVHAKAYSMIPPLSEQLGVSSKLPRVIAEYFDSAIALGHKDSELAALFEVLSQAD